MSYYSPILQNIGIKTSLHSQVCKDVFTERISESKCQTILELIQGLNQGLFELKSVYIQKIPPHRKSRCDNSCGEVARHSRSGFLTGDSETNFSIALSPDVFGKSPRLKLPTFLLDTNSEIRWPLVSLRVFGEAELTKSSYLRYRP